MRMTSLWSSLTLLTLAGCAAVGPPYQAPSPEDLHLPTAWYRAVPTVPATRHQAWWSELGDATLDTLVARTQADNPSVDIASARLRQSQAWLTQARAAAAPALVGQASVLRGNPAQVAPNVSSVAVSSAWELDLFGAVTRATQSAQAKQASTQADLAAVRVSLAAEVATNYSAWRECIAVRELADKDALSREATARLTDLKAEAGFVAPYLAARARASVEEGRTNAASLQAQCAKIENALATLSGLPPSELGALLRPPADIPAPKELALVLPAEVLAQRPDLVSAERLLAAASADIGTAEANRYPRLTINGTVGYGVTQTGAGTVSLGSWSVGPSLSLPLLDGGTRRAAVSAAEARYAEALASYRQKVRGAWQEVEDGLTQYASATARTTTAALAARDYRIHFAALDARYREGAASLLELEDARRLVLTAEQTELATRLERVEAWIALHRATGGGWSASALN